MTKRPYRPWKPLHRVWLLDYLGQGMPFAQIAVCLGRTESEVRNMAARLTGQTRKAKRLAEREARQRARLQLVRRDWVLIGYAARSNLARYMIREGHANGVVAAAVGVSHARVSQLVRALAAAENMSRSDDLTTSAGVPAKGKRHSLGQGART